MPKDDEITSIRRIGQDVLRKLTHEDLVKDVTSMVNQAEQFYLPGEVEITVLMAFRGETRAVAVATTVDNSERLRWTYKYATEKIPFLAFRPRRGKI